MAVEVDKICRTCLGLSGPLLSIYDDDSKSCLADMLRDFTNMKPTPSDKLPTKVCLTCISEINRCYSFKLKCEQSNRALRQLIPDAIPEEQAIVPVKVLNASSQTNATEKVLLKNVETQTMEMPFTPRIAKTNKENMETENTFPNNKANENAYPYEDSNDSSHCVAVKEALLTDASSHNFDNDFNSYEIECVDEGGEYVVQVKQVGELTESTAQPSAELENMLLKPIKSQGESIYEITQANDNAEYNIETLESATSLARNPTQKIVEIVFDALSKRNVYKCSECTQHFVSLNVLRRHLVKFHDLYVSEAIAANIETKNKNKNNDESPDDAMLGNICQQCKATFTTKRALDLHIKKNVCNMQSHKCLIKQCERVFDTAAQLEAHIANDHAAKHIECLDCKESFHTQEDLSKHQVEKHKRSLKLQCNICKKVFTMMSTLKDHLRIHTGEKPFQCTQCDKAFSQKSNLKQHMQRHVKEKMYICTECDDSFVTRSELFSHQRKHTGAQPFKCDFCGVAFSSSSTLNKHRRVHTGEKPYACDICPMRFAALNVLKNHRRTHTGEKPYACKICNKKFTQQGDCIVHMKKHDNAKCHHCLCGKKFPILSQLAKHQKKCKPIKVEPEDAGETMQKSINESLENVSDELM